MPDLFEEIPPMLLADVPAKRGAKGDPGEKGDNGDKGDPGKDGVDGIDGKKGDKGQRGEKGDRGAKGLRGLSGKDGRDGKDGKSGKDGKKGDPGKDGAPGKDGDKGDKGDQGDTPEHQVDVQRGLIRFRKPNGKWGEWIGLGSSGGNGGGSRRTIRKDDTLIGSGTGRDPLYVNPDLTLDSLTVGTATIENILALFAPVVYTESASMSVTDRVVICKDGAFTLELPPIADSLGVRVYVKNAASNVGNDITIDGFDAETIDAYETIILSTTEAVTMYCDGIEWHIL